MQRYRCARRSPPVYKMIVVVNISIVDCWTHCQDSFGVCRPRLSGDVLNLSLPSVAHCLFMLAALNYTPSERVCVCACDTCCEHRTNY